jgi:hypothetical protein
VAELPAHVRDRRSLLKQQAGKRMAHLVPEPELRPKLTGHVNLAPLVIFRCRKLSADQIAADLDERAGPIQIAPLDCQQLASPQAGSQATQQPDVPVGKPLAGDAQHFGNFVTRKWIDFGLGIIGGAEVAPRAEGPGSPVGARPRRLVTESYSASARSRVRSSP